MVLNSIPNSKTVEIKSSLFQVAVNKIYNSHSEESYKSNLFRVIKTLSPEQLNEEKKSYNKDDVNIGNFPNPLESENDKLKLTSLDFLGDKYESQKFEKYNLQMAYGNQIQCISILDNAEPEDDLFKELLDKQNKENIGEVKSTKTTENIIEAASSNILSDNMIFRFDIN